METAHTGLKEGQFTCLNAGELRYLSLQTPETLALIREVFRKSAAATRAQATAEIQVTTTKEERTAAAALLLTLNRLTEPLTHDPSQAEACARQIEHAMAMIDMMIAAKRANQVTGEPESNGSLSPASMQLAHQQLQEALEGATPRSHQAICRYGLACAFVALGHSTASQVSSTNILNPRTAISTQGTTHPTLVALAQFLELNGANNGTTSFLEGVLGMRRPHRPSSLPGDQAKIAGIIQTKVLDAAA